MASIDEYLNSRIAGGNPDGPVPLGNDTTIELTAEGTPVDAPVVGQVAEPVVEVAPVVDQVADPALEVEGQPLATNWRLKADTVEEKQMAALIRSGTSWKEAADRVYGVTIAPAAADPHVEQVADQPAITEVIASKEARLAEIDAILDREVEDSGGVGVTLTAEIRALQKESQGILRELPTLQTQARSQQNAEQREFNHTYGEWEAAAIADFPDIAVKGTPFYAAVAAESERLAASDDPILQLPDCAYLVAARIARTTGYKAPVGSAAVAAPVVAQPAAAAQAALPPPVTPRAVGSVSGGAASDAHRVTVAPVQASALDSYRETVAARGRGAEGIMAGLDSMIKGFAGAAAAR